MPLTPKEIEQKTFTASFRGYAEDEVDVFLEEVIVSVAEYQQMIRDRDARLADAGSTPAGVRDAATANEEARRILQAAKRQAEQIVSEARARAQQAGIGSGLTPEQVADRDRLLVGYERLRGELATIRARVHKALTASQEAFGIMEGQVGALVEAARPGEAVAEGDAETPAPPAPVASEAPAPTPPPSEDPTPAPGPETDVAEASRPRRPWER